MRSRALIIAGDFNHGFQQKHFNRHCNLKQIIKQPTRKSNALELIFSNIAISFEVPENLAPLSTSDHNIINWKVKCHIVERGNTVIKIKVGKIRQQRLDSFGISLENCDWSSVFNTLAINEKVEDFLKITRDMVKTIKIYLS